MHYTNIDSTVTTNNSNAETSKVASFSMGFFIARAPYITVLKVLLILRYVLMCVYVNNHMATFFLL